MSQGPVSAPAPNGTTPAPAPSHGERPSGPPSRGGGKPGGKYGKFRRQRRKVCIFCVEKVKSIDYKQMARISKRLTTDRGKIVPRRTTGTCAKHQRMVSEAIKRARHMALVAFVTD